MLLQQHFVSELNIKTTSYCFWRSLAVNKKILLFILLILFLAGLYLLCSFKAHNEPRAANETISYLEIKDLIKKYLFTRNKLTDNHKTMHVYAVVNYLTKDQSNQSQ